MFQHPIIITDNAAICSEFLQISNELLPDITFTIGTSPFSVSKEFTTDVRMVNMKKKQDVNFLIDNFDIIISLHCKQLFPEKLVKAKKCINIHPGYNPVNRGWYPQVFSIIHDLKIGATIHEITNDLDNGPIIARAEVDKYLWDTSLTLYDRVVEKEMELLKTNLDKIIYNEYETFVSEENSNIFYKKDFEEQKQINLNEKATYKEVINRLRALSHAGFKNAYFKDENGEKIYISLKLEKYGE